jgi:hypothetical protein
MMTQTHATVRLNELNFHNIADISHVLAGYLSALQQLEMYQYHSCDLYCFMRSSMTIISTGSHRLSSRQTIKESPKTNYISTHT